MQSTTSALPIDNWDLAHAFAAFMEGAVPEEEPLFEQAAMIFVDKARRGHGLGQALADEKKCKAQILAFRVSYLACKEKGDLLPLLQTEFMQELIASAEPCRLGKEEKKLLFRVIIPVTLQSIGKEQLVLRSVSKEKTSLSKAEAAWVQWFQHYHMAAITPKMIENNVKSYQGLKKQQMLALSDKKAEISLKWYQQYKKGAIMREEIETFYHVCKGAFAGDMSSEEGISASLSWFLEEEIGASLSRLLLPEVLQSALADYVDLAKQFPENNRCYYVRGLKANIRGLLSASKV